MTFTEILLEQTKGVFPGFLYWFVLPLIPFFIAERLWPVDKAPSLREYGTNLLITLSMAYLAMPIGIIAGLCSAQVRDHLPWEPISFTFSSIGTVPVVGPVLEIVTMTFVALFLHDCWYYWAHRLEHKIPVLWQFHKLHHDDEHMNTATWARVHFLEGNWIAFFSMFTLGLIIDLQLKEAGRAALYSSMIVAGLSMFYHASIRIQLPWLDRLIVTPQVHRIHHSIGPEHYNTNFADVLPIFDIVFGTYRRPAKDQFPATGVGPDSPQARSIWAAQFGPLLAVGKMLIRRWSWHPRPSGHGNTVRRNLKIDSIPPRTDESHGAHKPGIRKGIELIELEEHGS